MTQDELIEHLQDCGCKIVRRANRGYTVMRNLINGKMSGVPVPTGAAGQLRPTTICQVCKTLEVTIPDCAKDGEEIVDYVRAKHIEKNDQASNN